MTVASGTALAKDVEPLSSGARVRVSLAGTGGKHVGTLLVLDDQNVTLRVADRLNGVVVPRSDIARLAVSTGHGSRGKNALWGMLIGAGAGAVIGIAGGATGDSSEKTKSAVESGLVLAFLGAPVGGLLGAAIPPGERWKDVPLDRVRVGVGRAGKRSVTIFATLTF
jgi:precorrin-6x reductase